MAAKFTPALKCTRNFFRLYQHICGESEVPAVYNFWASVAVLAAVLENRVWFEKHRNKKLFPHLYIFLVGPGGLGKGTAIDQAVDLIEASVPDLHTFRGPITYAHLIDVLGRSEADEYGRKITTDPRLWLIMDELKNDIGSNQNLAEAFIALMTELYTASNYTMQTGTRTGGERIIHRPLVNWLAGSTENWLKLVLTRDLVDSGFTARACFIFGQHDFGKRCPRITYPPDYDEVMEHLQNRLWMLQNSGGRILMSPEAEAAEDHWYMTRQNPDDEAMYSIWRRQHDMLLKFAQINAIADGGDPIITINHLKRAKAMVQQNSSYTARLLEVAHETYDTKPANDIEIYIRNKGKVDHSTALRYFRSKKGMNAEKFKKAIWGLIQEGSIKFEKTTTGGAVYYGVEDQSVPL